MYRRGWWLAGKLFDIIHVVKWDSFQPMVYAGFSDRHTDVSNLTTIPLLSKNITNFLLNKAWTFEDKDFSIKHTSKQYLLFFGISSAGAALQLILTYILVELSHIGYEAALIVAVMAASIGNFLLNKKLTFKEKIWG